MQTEIYTQTRKRGLMGKLCQAIFWLWNLAFALVIFGPMIAGGNASGAMVSVGFLLIGGTTWAIGAVVFGILSYITRGEAIITKTIKEQ